MFVMYDVCCFFFQAEDGIRDLVRSRGLGDVYKRQVSCLPGANEGYYVHFRTVSPGSPGRLFAFGKCYAVSYTHLTLPTIYSV